MENTDEKDIIQHSVGFMLGLVFVTLLIMYEGWVASLLWSWFVVRLGVPAISVTEACGLMVFVGICTFQYYECNQYKRLGYTLFNLTWCLMLGFVIHKLNP